MNTETIVVGAPEPQPKKKPVEFVTYLERKDYINGSSRTIPIYISTMTPNCFKYVELICKKYNEKLDLMFAYNNPDNRGETALLFLGYWNDGFVE